LFVLFGIMLLILAVAIGVLFAMCAELSNRIGTSGGGTGTGTVANYVRPVGRPEVYLREDVTWPQELAGVSSRDAFLLLVLSTSCQTCGTAADELADGWAARGAGRLGLVISTPGISRATTFVSDHGLADIPLFIDDGGEWVTRSLGLSLSPVGLVFIDGRLHESYVFNNVETMWHTFTEEVFQCAQSSQSRPAGSAAAGSSRPSAPVA